MKKLREMGRLFLIMFKIGLFTFGGGHAMLAFLENEFVSKRGWVGKDEFLDMVVISESTPGPIAINIATYLGYQRAGFLGAVAATVGMCVPSLIVIYVISLFFDAFLSFSLVQHAFRGIQACVVYLVLLMGIKLLKSVKKDIPSIVVLGTVFLCSLIFSLFAVNFSSIFYILICGALGVLLYLIRRMTGKEEKQ